MMSRVNIEIALGMAVIAVVLVGAGKAVKTDTCCAPGNTKTAELSAEAGPALVCTLTEAGLRERRTEILELLTGHALSVTEESDGFVIAFADGHAREIVEFVELERECCRFFTFDLSFPADRGPVSLRISGPEGAKDFLEGMLANWRESIDATD